MLHITGIQFDIAWENKKQNIATLENEIAEVSSKTDILILPEMFTTGFSMNPVPHSEQMSGDTVMWMQSVSVRLNAAVCGSLMIDDNGIYRNRFIWVTPTGSIEYYDKRHPFCLIEEGKYFAKGNKRQVFTYKNWRIFPAICYDLRFPVWNRNDLSYDLMINVANWPAVRSYSWKQFLSARALENQAYVVGINRVGKDFHNNDFTGDSRIIGFNGKTIVAAKANTQERISAVISKQELEKYRAHYPFLADRDAFRIEI